MNKNHLENRENVIERSEAADLYFSRISSSYRAMNRFQEEVQREIKVYDGLVLHSRVAFENHLRELIDSIHAKYPMCKNLTLDNCWGRPGKDKQLRITASGKPIIIIDFHYVFGVREVQIIILL